MRTKIFLVLVWFAACSPPKDPSSAEYWIDRLDREEMREEAIQKLGELKDKKAVPALVELLKSSPNDKPAAAQSLGMIGDPSSIPPLLAALDPGAGSGADEATRTKHRANERIMQALASLHAKDAEDPILKELRAADKFERIAAVHALGDVGSKKSVAPLCDVVRSDDDMFLKKTATESLGNIADPDAAPCLVEAMFIENRGSIYPEAEFALVQVGPSAEPVVIQALIRKNAAVEKMASEKHFVDGAVEAKAIEVIGDLRNKQAEDPLIAIFKTTKNPIIQRNIAIALSRFGGSKSVEAISKVMNEPAADLRQFYADALNELSDRAALPALLAASKAGDPGARGVAFLAYSRLGDARDLPAASAIGGAKDAGEMAKEMVRFSAAKECGDSADCWIGKLKSPEAKVRDRAGYALGRIGDKKAAPALAQAAKDDNLEARAAALWALYRVGTKAIVPDLENILVAEASQSKYVGINEELKRLVIFLKRQQ